MSSRFIHVVACVRISFLFKGRIVFHCMYVSRFVYSFICWWALGWFHVLATEIWLLASHMVCAGQCPTCTQGEGSELCLLDLAGLCSCPSPLVPYLASGHSIHYWEHGSGVSNSCCRLVSLSLRFYRLLPHTSWWSAIGHVAVPSRFEASVQMLLLWWPRPGLPQPWGVTALCSLSVTWLRPCFPASATVSNLHASLPS